MKHRYTEEDKKKLTRRLNIISGQVNGIKKMIDEDRECIEILNQILSMEAAIRGVWKQVVKGHLEHCIVGALKDKKQNNELIEELVEHIEQLR